MSLKRWQMWSMAALAGAASLTGRRGIRAWREMHARRYPAFVYDDDLEGEIGVPVFTYHSLAGPETPDSITPQEFEADLQYLARNKYVTLTADELYAHLVLGESIPARSVVLAFDDGRASLWTVACPLLRQYGLKAVCFLVPGSVTEGAARPVPHVAGEVDPPEVDLSATPSVTWEEVRLMHASGTIDFQSHTLDHALIHYSPQIVDFISPSYRAGFGAYGVPVVRDQGIDRVDRRLLSGTPVYQSKPRMEAARRFFDDEAVRSACIDFALEQGGDAFFMREGWHDELLAFACRYRREHPLHEEYETSAEQAGAIRHSLEESKRQIESHLPGHVVRHLCYPWHRYSMLAAALAQEVGYLATTIDINPQKPWPRWNDPYVVQRRLPVNVYGDDPHQISRIDAREGVVRSLPGAGRITYRQRLISKLLGRWS